MKVYCTFPFTKLKIDADGSYHSCCHQSGYYGNLIKDDITLEEAFKNLKLREVKNDVLSFKLHSLCDNLQCPHKHTTLNENEDVEIRKYPLHIELALHPTLCNIGGTKPSQDTACIMCPRSSDEFMKLYAKDYTFEIVEKIKPAMPDLGVLSILGIAEPFWKNTIFDIFDVLEFKKYKDNILFWTYSNGTVFDKQKQEKLIDEYTKKTCIGFSLDAATESTYKKIRKLNLFNDTIQNIENYFNKINNLKDREDWSFLTFNINMLNINEMSDMILLAQNMGIKKIQFTLTHKDYKDTAISNDLICNKSNWKLFHEAQLKATELAKEKNVFVEFYTPFHNGFLKNL